MRSRPPVPNDRARHPWDHPVSPPTPGRSARRWIVRAVVLSFIAVTLYPALGESESVDVAVDCGPAMVGTATQCTATITAPTAFATLESGTSSSVNIGAFGNELGMIKPIAPGIFTRGSMPSAGTPVRVATVNVNWSALETTRDIYTLGPIESQLDAAEARGLAGVRLRVMLGRYSPDWAKAIGDGPVTYTHVHGGAVTGTVPDLWDPSWQAEAAELFAEIAARYDTDPRLLLIFATGGMTWYGEPLLRAVSYEPNRTNFLAAGYTRTADEALQRVQLDWLKAFKLTPVGLAYNRYEFIRADGTAGSDLTFVGSLMDHHIANFGARTVLQNNSIRSDYIGAVPPLYELFLDRSAAPGTTSYQTAAAVRIGDADATMHWAIDYLKASGVELVDGYPNFHTDAELTDYDTALGANDPSSEQPTTHAVSWSTSGNGTFSGSSCAPGGVGVTTCTVRYLPSSGSVGEHTIIATYTGSAISSGPASTQVRVLPRASATTLTCATLIPAGGKSHCTATVSDGSGSQVIAPIGTVRIAVDGVEAASCALGTTSGSISTCEVDVTATADTHQVTAAYTGDVDHAASTSGPVQLTVEAPPAEAPPEPEPTPEPEPMPEPEPTPEPEPVVDTVVPVVTITSPADGTSIKKGRKLMIVATATDETGVTRVDFASKGTVVCSDTTPTTWTCSWNVAKNGSDGFDVRVTAYDAAGNSASAQISVKVITGRV